MRIVDLEFSKSITAAKIYVHLIDDSAICFSKYEKWKKDLNVEMEYDHNFCAVLVRYIK